jgi:hypothetical protein
LTSSFWAASSEATVRTSTLDKSKGLNKVRLNGVRSYLPCNRSSENIASEKMAIVRRDLRGRCTETGDAAAENTTRTSDTTKKFAPVLKRDDGDSVRYIIGWASENYNTSWRTSFMSQPI